MFGKSNRKLDEHLWEKIRQVLGDRRILLADGVRRARARERAGASSRKPTPTRSISEKLKGLGYIS